ncbi:hypothetical protein R7Q40_22820 [Vibrio sp. 506]|nr:hypothetical protein [Vibrio sp. 506]MDW2057163.1 hypothetical protein [Vibrio sp. 506]
MINLSSNPSVMIFKFKLLISELLRKVTAGIAQCTALALDGLLSQTLCFFIDAKVKMRNRRATHFCIGAMTGKGHDDINEMKGRHTPVSR